MPELAPPGAWDAAWDTSTRTGSVALARGQNVVQRELAGARAHASDLLPTLRALCAEQGLDPRRPEHVFVGLGPGSYTGLRVGIATALGVARGAGCRVIGLPSYDAIAFDGLVPGQEGVVVGDARRGTAYLGHYARTDDDVERLAPLRLVRIDELPRALPGHAIVLAEAGLLEHAELPGTALPLPVPQAAHLIRLGRIRAARADGADEFELEPLYLRDWGDAPAARP